MYEISLYILILTLYVQIVSDSTSKFSFH